jgi:hypothetical protein
MKYARQLKKSFMITFFVFNPYRYHFYKSQLYHANLYTDEVGTAVKEKFYDSVSIHFTTSVGGSGE